jgi:hypothetical protein
MEGKERHEFSSISVYHSVPPNFVPPSHLAELLIRKSFQISESVKLSQKPFRYSGINLEKSRRE